MASQSKVFLGPQTEIKAHDLGAFDCLRLLAAAAVIFTHSYALLGLEAEEPFALRARGVFLSSVAVYAFFAISGFLVTQSWMRDPSLARFMRRRALRIFPALVFVILGSFAVLGPLVTSENIRSYFESQEAWSYVTKIFIYPAQLGLPGVFDTNPFPKVVNGSLWTLRLEFAFYIVVAILGVMRCLRFRITGILLAGAALTAYLSLEVFKAHQAPKQLLDLTSNAVPFFVGMALAESDVKGRKLSILAAAASAVAALLYVTPFFTEAVLVVTPVLVICAARNLNCRLGKSGDYSYGLYLWAFPVAQFLIAVQGITSVAGLFFETFLLALLLAAVSWHCIERPALLLKPRRSASGA